MNRKQFKEIMTEVIRLRELENKVSEVLQNYDNDFNRLFFSPYESLVVKTLQIAMRDEYDWIGYWLYECDCGRSEKSDSVTDKDGKHIPLRTIDDLYNIIKK